MKDLSHPYSQKIIVKKLTEHSAFLQLPDGQEIEWDKSLLPTDLEEGLELTMIVHNKKTEQDERLKFAKQLLNELFEEKTT